jgi:hypothetical protein
MMKAIISIVSVMIWLVSMSSLVLGKSSSSSSSGHSSGSHYSPPTHYSPLVYHTPSVPHTPAVRHAPPNPSASSSRLNNTPIRTQFRDKSGKLWGTAITRGNRSEFRNASGKLLTKSTTYRDGKTEVRDSSGNLLLKISPRQ